MGQWENIEDVFPYKVNSPSKNMDEYQEKWLWLVHKHNLKAHEDFTTLDTVDPKYQDLWWFADPHVATVFGLTWGIQDADNSN